MSSSSDPSPPSAADGAQSALGHVRLGFDEALTLLFIGFLLLASLVTTGPSVDTLDRARLTMMTVGGLLVVLLLVMLLRARADAQSVQRFVRHWWPLPAGLFAYESLKHMHANRITQALGIPPLDAVMIQIDQLLFGEVLPLRMEWMITPWMTQLMRVSYEWGYYLWPILAMGLLYVKRTDVAAFLHVRRAIMTTLFGGYVMYLLIPVAGPMYTMGEKFTRPIDGYLPAQRLFFDVLRYNWDCFPSLHTAVPWVIVLSTFRYFGTALRALQIMLAVSVTLSTLYLRWHYGIDVIAGIAWAAAVHLATRDNRSQLELAIPRALALHPVRWRLGVIAGLFVVTGCSALVVEQAFEKVLSTVVGASTPASAIVLAVYFLGLSLGSIGYAAIGTRVRSPLQLYGLLECAIGAWALLFWFVLGPLVALSSQIVHAAGQQPALVLLARLFVACLWILPPTIAMGATFPAMVGALRQLRVPQVQRMMSRFYALNILGAFIGALLAPYKLIPEFGLTGAMLVVTVAELCVFFVVIGLGARLRPLRATAIAASPFRQLRTSFTAMSATSGGRVLLIAGFLSGFVAFGYEVLWVHLVGAVVGTSVYAFANMLAMVLLGLFLGGFLTSTLFRRSKTLPQWALPALVNAAALALAYTFGAWDDAPGFLAKWGTGLTAFEDGEILRLITCAYLVGFPAVLMGLVYPALFRLDWFPAAHADGAAGVLGAINSLGSILGSLVTGFVLLPVIGSEACYFLFLVVLVALSSAILAYQWRHKRARGIGFQAAFAVLALVVAIAEPWWDPLKLTSGYNVYFAPRHVFANVSRISYWHEDAQGGFTTVVENPQGSGENSRTYKTLLTNGKFQANDSFEVPAQISFALIPILHQPRRERALVIGLGSGQSAHVVRAAGFQQIDVAEFSDGIVEAARTEFGNINHDVVDQPNVHLFLEDGRNHLLRTRARYDLITMEVSSIWFAGSGSLYSLEFYRLAAQRLAPGGVFQQWLQLHHITPAELMSALVTVRQAFTNVTLWYMGGQAIVVASQEPLAIAESTLAELERRPQIPELQELLRRWGYPSLRDVHKRIVLDPYDVDFFVRESKRGGVFANTDANRYLEYATPRYNLSRADHAAANVQWILERMSPAKRTQRREALGLDRAASHVAATEAGTATH